MNYSDFTIFTLSHKTIEIIIDLVEIYTLLGPNMKNFFSCLFMRGSTWTS